MEKGLQPPSHAKCIFFNSISLGLFHGRKMCVCVYANHLLDLNWPPVDQLWLYVADKSISCRTLTEILEIQGVIHGSK